MRSINVPLYDGDRMKISDITPYLPSAQREALERGGEILQALIVRGGEFTAASQAAQSGVITVSCKP